MANLTIRQHHTLRRAAVTGWLEPAGALACKQQRLPCYAGGEVPVHRVNACGALLLNCPACCCPAAA